MKRNYMPPSCVAYYIAPSTLIADSTKVLDRSEGNKLEEGEILTKESDNWNLWGDDDDE